MATTVDSARVSVDATGVTIDATGARAPLPGWPCALLGTSPPSVADRQSNPTADDLLPAVLALAPRGAAWGTDEAGDGQGASPVMRRVWRAIAGWAAGHLARDFTVATQAFPSAVTASLPDWEMELGLPDPCTPGLDISGRLNAVRVRFGAIGGCSPAYFVCLAASLGYDITIEEPTQFLCDVSEVVDGGIEETWFTIDDGECDGTPLEGFTLTAAVGTVGDEVAGGIEESYFCCDDGECDGDPLESFSDDPAGTVWKYWVVHVPETEPTWFTIDDGELDFTPLEGFRTAASLECVLRRACPPHTQLVFSYTPAASPPLAA